MSRENVNSESADTALTRPDSLTAAVQNKPQSQRISEHTVRFFRKTDMLNAGNPHFHPTTTSIFSDDDRVIGSV